MQRKTFNHMIAAAVLALGAAPLGVYAQAQTEI